MIDDVTKIVVQQSNLWGTKIALSIAIFVIFWIAAKISTKAVVGLSARTRFDPHVAGLLGKATRVSLLIFGGISALGTLGVNVSAIVAGLGLTGFALGFALKDTISNLLAGVLILIFSPFKIGDYIKIGGYEGLVLSIDMRYTILEKDEDRILIPNSKLFTDPITVKITAEETKS